MGPALARRASASETLVSTPPKIIRLTTKTFADIIKEVKQCRCQFSSAAGRHDRADTWTLISVDILSTPTEPLASQAGSVLAMFDFKYLALRCEEEASESEPSSSHASAPQSAFDRLFAAQHNVHLPTAKQAQNKKEELFNDVSAVYMNHLMI